MEYINDINIQEAVIHVLDTNGDQPILNEYRLELNEDIYKYLYKHIEKCFNDEDLKYAKFNPERNIVKEVVQDYLNGIDSDLIEISKEIAKQLFIIMKGNADIPSCDLLVVSVLTDQGPMIGILKMDYVKKFTHQIDFIKNKIGVDLVAQKEILPGSGQRIQKAAFIKPIRENSKFDLMILNKQKRIKDEEEYGANYFINNFLGCSLESNERDQTRNFINWGEKWIRQNYSEDAAESERIRNIIRENLETKDEININKFATEVLKGEEVAENFKLFMSGVVDEDIKIDKKYVEKKINKVKLKIDREIDLTISKEAYQDKSRFEILRNGDGSINMIIKNVSNYIQK